MKLLAKSVSILTFILLLCGCDETVVLFNSLDEQQANPIMAILQENHLSCQKSAGEENTWKLMVKQRDFAKAVEICQQHGLPQQIYHGVGDVFKKTGMVSSPTEERIRFMDALAQDLSRTISEIDGVISARVHIVLPNNDPFAKNVLPSSAAVAIRHRSDCDLEDHIPEIKNLVMNAIEGVEYDKITVTLFKVIVAPKDAMTEQSAGTSKISDDMMRILVTANASLAVLLAVVLVLVIMRLILGKRHQETPKPAAK
ncbi:MAG: type III secretion inner membrane ring lipoprotein SctJ [Victivallales bacterium]|nr:type III secretion inner membrane ring lipoprotein SctJ [Victivallales bacterium]